jgi:hypothetical protein
MPAQRAAFGTGIELVNRHDGTPIPGRLVLKLSDQFSPTHIGYRLCQRVMLEHILDVQRLDTDHLIIADESSRQFVQEITPSISNAGIDTSDPLAGLLSILGAFLLAGMGTLGTRQALSILQKKALIAGLLAGRERHHIMQAQVYPNRLRRDGQRGY